MTTKPHPPTRFLRWLIALAILAIPAWAHEDHEPEASAASGATGVSLNDLGSSGEPDAGESADDTEYNLAPDSPLYRSIKYAGKFHLLFIHFPIAFLLGAAIAQWHMVLRSRGQPVVDALLWAGAIGAIIAATLGWMYAYDSVYFGDDAKLLSMHRWLGTSVAILASATLIVKPKLSPMGVAISLTLCAALVAAAAHFGGSLVYGSEFLIPEPS